jgi:Stage II sporulation protein E (SpoIIE)/GAF domain
MPLATGTRPEAEVQVTDDPDATAGGRVGSSGLPGSAPSAEDALILGTGLDLSEIARLVLGAILPGLADIAGVFALEQLLRGGEPAVPGGRLVARRLGTRFAHPVEPGPETVFPPGEVIVFAADSPCARCVYRGEPQSYEQADGHVLDQTPSSREILSAYQWFLAVPMTAGGTVTGFLILARAPGRPPFSEADTATAVRLAAHAGTGIANAVKLMRQRSIADALQRGLLVSEPPVPSGLEVAGRCQPAAGHSLGGDWYDLIPLPEGRTGIVVGDVMGHGPEAAAVMAQLRAGAHALADMDLAPAELLHRLNRLAAMLHRITLATCVYTVIDPAGQACTLAGAGHLPPVLALPDGTTRVPDLPAGQSLGLGTAIYGQARIKLPPGAILALYTDGLVETRTRSYDHGILALRSLLTRERGPLETVCDALVSSLAERYEDDITVVLARIPARR